MPHAPNRASRHGALFAVWFLSVATPVLAQDPVLADENFRRPPESIAKAVLAPRYLNVTLSNVSPDQKYFLRQQSAGMPPMSSFAREHLWFAGLQVDPRANRTRSFSINGAPGLSVIEWETGRAVDIQLPKGATASGAQWSPDGRAIAYFANFDDVTHVFVADIPGARSRQVTKTPVLATINTALEWTADGKSVFAVMVPDNRGAPPVVPAVPVGPKVRMTTAGENPNRSYASLLEWPHEKQMLKYYTTGQLAAIDVTTRNVRKIGAPAMIRSVDASPRGDYVRVTIMQEPFSYIVPQSSFGSREELWSADGKLIARLSERPLNEGMRTTPGTDDAPGQAPGTDPNGKRALAWNADGSGMTYLQVEPAAARNGAGRQGAAPADTAGAQSRRKDRVMEWLPPFDSTSTRVIYENDTRMSSVRFSADGKTLFISDGTAATAHTFAVFLSDPAKKHTILRGRNDDFYKDPGTLLGMRGPIGADVVRMSTDGSAVFLSGTQYFEKPREQGPRAFIDRFDIRAGTKSRVYEGDNNNVNERIVQVLDQDATRMIVSREGPALVADAYLREPNGQLRKITNNKDYSPEVTAAQRKTFTVTRSDGFQFKVDVKLPADYRPGTKLPAMFWFYPREYTDQKTYDQGLRTYNKNAFPSLSVRSMDFLTLEGYAVVEPDAPIVGDAGRMNDNYENDLRNNLAATIDHLEKEGIIDRERLGVGGHSYGAFSTVNAMVHTPFFKAGIAGDGAYNRTLTPLGFQTERRDMFDGRETYLNMSPILYANNLTGALLMYHGMDDQNVGTDPINSTRLFTVLDGLGKNAALYMYPYEDHGPATRETILDLWSRWVHWLDIYVKNPKGKDPKITTN